jgi:hypothetical protein
MISPSIECEAVRSIEALKHRKAAADLDLFDQQRVLGVRGAGGFATLREVIGKALEVEVQSLDRTLTSRI